MPDYIDYPITTDPETLQEEAYAYIQAKVPGWSPNAGNLEVILIESMSRMVADARDTASAVPKSIFRYFGNSVLGVASRDDTQASADSTWVARDNKGYTIPAGTQVGLRAAGDELVAFQTSFDVVIPPGSTSTAVGAVGLVASLPGAKGSGLGPTAELIDPLDWVASVTLTDLTTGGQDGETDDEYLNRLADYLTLLSPVPILPNDFAVFVLAQGDFGVGRALALDGYDPTNGSLNNERMVTLVVADAVGEELSTGAKVAIDTAIQAVREINFIVNVIDPEYTSIDVAVSFTVLPGSNPSTVSENVEAALEDYLSPANWGKTTFGEGVSSDWRNATSVQVYEVVTVVNNVSGVDRVASITIGKTGGAQGNTDIGLDGPAPLTRAGQITATPV